MNTPNFDDILKTFTNSSYSMSLSCETAIGDACPIWKLLGLTEKEYYIKYPPVDLSSNVVEKDEKTLLNTRSEEDLKKT